MRHATCDLNLQRREVKQTSDQSEQISLDTDRESCFEKIFDPTNRDAPLSEKGI